MGRPLWQQQQQQQPMPHQQQHQHQQRQQQPGGGPNELLPPLPAFGTPPSSRAPGPGAYPTPAAPGPPPSSVPGSGSRARSSYRPGLRPRCDMALLDDRLRALARSLEPTEEEKAAQRRALEAVRAALLRRWPGAAAGAASRLSVFGSVASGMQVTKSNDLDLTLELDDVADDDAAGKGRAVEEAAAALDEANEEWEKEARRKEGGNGGDGSVSSPSSPSVLFDSILPLPRARVPVLKFRHVPTGTKVDVTINNRLALHNTRHVFFSFLCFTFGRRVFFRGLRQGKKNLGSSSPTHLIFLPDPSLKPSPPPPTPAAQDLRVARRGKAQGPGGLRQTLGQAQGRQRPLPVRCVFFTLLSLER